MNVFLVKNMINKNNWNKFITLFVTVLSFIFVYHGFSTKSFASSIAFLNKITAPDKSVEIVLVCRYQFSIKLFVLVLQIRKLMRRPTLAKFTFLD